MKNKNTIFILLILLMTTISTSTVSLASEKNENLSTEADEGKPEKDFIHWLITFSRTKGVAPVSNETYKDECGACHFPYQPGLLPEQSWKKIFNAKQMEDHFGDNAELDEEVRTQLLTYVTRHSADKSWYKRSRKIMSSLDENLTDDQYPIRITQVPYIKEKHSEIPKKLIQDNDKVNSLSYCDNCHQKASEGIYDDDTVSIPQ